MTPIAPSTRTSATPGSDAAGARPVRSPASISATRARQSWPSSSSTDATATAQASALAMNVGPCISAPGSCVLIVCAMSRGAQRRGQRDVAAGERLADAHDVGADAGVVGGEQLTGAAEAGGDLVEDQQHVVAVADRAQVDQVARVVEPHAARALHDGFDDDGGQFVGVLGQLLFRTPAL